MRCCQRTLPRNILSGINIRIQPHLTCSPCELSLGPWASWPSWFSSFLLSWLSSSSSCLWMEHSFPFWPRAFQKEKRLAILMEKRFVKLCIRLYQNQYRHRRLWWLSRNMQWDIVGYWNEQSCNRVRKQRAIMPKLTQSTPAIGITTSMRKAWLTTSWW